VELFNCSHQLKKQRDIDRSSRLIPSRLTKINDLSLSEKRIGHGGREKADRAGPAQLGNTHPATGLFVLLAHEHVRLLRIVLEFCGVRRR